MNELVVEKRAPVSPLDVLAPRTRSVEAGA